MDDRTPTQIPARVELPIPPSDLDQPGPYRNDYSLDIEAFIDIYIDENWNCNPECDWVKSAHSFQMSQIELKKFAKILLSQDEIFLFDGRDSWLESQVALVKYIVMTCKYTFESFAEGYHYTDYTDKAGQENFIGILKAEFVSEIRIPKQLKNNTTLSASNQNLEDKISELIEVFYSFQTKFDKKIDNTKDMIAKQSWVFDDTIEKYSKIILSLFALVGWLGFIFLIYSLVN